MLNKKLFSIFSLSILLGLGCLVGCGGNDGDKTTPTPTTPTPEPKDTYEVSFYVDGNLYGETLTVNAGEKITKPADPTREADEDYTYTFAGWYENGAETPWNFDTDVVNKDLDLFAEFDEIARAYDLIVYVLGGSDSTVYITEDEIARVEATFESKHTDKDILFKFFPAMKNDAFNAKVLSVKNKPDVIISGSKMDSGDNALTLNGTYPKTKVGLGWFSSTTRYIGVYEACSEHLELAAALHGDMTAHGPDYFTVDKESVTLMMGQTDTVTVTLGEGDTRTPTYEIVDTSIAIVDNGTISTVSVGNTTLKVTVGLVTVEIAVEVIENIDYDLVVWVYGVNGATTPTTYITEAESDNLKAEFLKLDAAKDKQIYWIYSTGLKNPEFNQAVIDANPTVDVVVSGAKLNNDDPSIGCNETYGKVKMGAGWFENASRYVAITSYCSENLELAIELYNLASSTGPSYEGVELDRDSATLIVGDEITLNATAYGEVTWSSDNDTVATVENGVVTAVGAGNATITVTAADGLTDTCVIEVLSSEEEKESYDLVVLVYLAASKSTYITTAEYEAIVAAFTAEGAAGYGKNILWLTYTGGNQAALGTYIAEQETEGNIADVIIARSGISTGKVGDLTIVEDTYKSVDVSWTADDGNYAAINTKATVSNIELGNALISMLSTAKAA